MSCSIVGIHFQGASVFSLGVGPVPLFLLNACKQDMRFSKVGVELQGFSGCANCFWSRPAGRSADKNCAKFAKSNCLAEVSRCERRVHLYRAIEIRDAFLNVSPAVAFVESSPALQIVFINFRR